MPDNGEGGAAAPNPPGGGTAHAGEAPIDVQRLAEKVYALMLKEARIGHARTESTAAPKRSLED
jgi:hypothetical protein